MPNLIGTGNNQVPTNGMLGGLAYQSPDNAVIKNLELTNLSGHNSVIPSNAVDVFVYDTRKDSDGGAWRKRTQHTSWYNETLNTATRGSRRDFPAVAVIVATTNTITIYDGDDPDMSMWMKFTDGYSTYLGMGIGGLTSVTMLNGIMVHGGQYDVHVTSFIADKTNRYGDNSGITVNHTQPISGRNNDTAGNYNGPTTPVIANRQVNDVAMTVLPNAPIDPSTGLPVPTIAVATNGGVSVIRDDGQVFDLTFSGQNGSKVWKITFDDKHQICMLLGYSNVYPYTSYIYHVPSSDTALSAVTDRVLNNPTYNFPSDAYGAANTSSGDINDYIDSKYFGTDKGMSFLTPNKNNIGGQLICHINTKFNSGWQHGDIKGAFLADTDATNVSGVELITNGTFDTDVSGWFGSRDAIISYNSGVMRIVTSSSIYGGAATQSFTTVVGKTYVASINIITPSTSVNSSLRINNGPDVTYTTIANNTFGTSSGIQTVTFTATATTTYIHINGQDLNRTIDVDNVSVRIADPDRSVNAKGLQVFGTITKSAVATGADLVAYSGFDASNYLRQPKDSIQYGTNNFYVTCWYKRGISNEEINIWGDSDRSATNAGFRLVLGNSTNDIYIVNGNFTSYAVFSGVGISAGTWRHLVFTREYNVGWKVYQNGLLVGSTSTFATSNYNSGGWFEISAGSNAINSQVSLVRTGFGIPSSEQIKKIYEDEKVLFQENAKCTLYGSSDAVTALAYDDSTNILYAGTSSGRSDFQGLRRINNTTTAVTTAISASNGLIAEQ